MNDKCPPRHAPYASRMLATNAVTLHQLAFPHCGGYESWPCGDHWHVGHSSKVAGDACKTDREHVSAGRRLRHVERLRQRRSGPPVP